MNPIEYIRRDIEGGDSDTRRRSAADLVKALTEQYEAQVTAMFTGYVAALLAVSQESDSIHICHKILIMCHNSVMTFVFVKLVW